MALMDIVKGICATSRCKYDVYTKEKMDEILSDTYVKDDYAVIELNDVAVATQHLVDYPEGFDYNNSIVVSLAYKQTDEVIPDSWKYPGEIVYETSATTPYVVLSPQKIIIKDSGNAVMHPEANISYKVVLLKIK